jgi:hypothetical protein
MVVFLGDSFTWGQGLHYYHLIENEEWSWEDCRNFLENNARFEGLGFEADEYRRNHSFPYLTGKKLNQPIVTPQFENGGDNYRIIDALNNINIFSSIGNFDFAIIQFSAPTRIPTELLNDSNLNSIDELIRHQIKTIDKICRNKNIEWFGLSWFEEFGEIMKNEFGKNHIPIILNGKEYDSFEFVKQPELRELTIQYTEIIDDGHFNLKGHEVISDSIVHKINQEIDNGNLKLKIYY